MTFTPEQHRAYRARLRKTGTCTRCRVKKSARGHQSCPACMKNNRSLAAGTYQRRKDLGLCVVCGGPRDDPSLVTCCMCSGQQVMAASLRRGL